jgi:exodeoxyribonuclease VII large subunit
MITTVSLDTIHTSIKNAVSINKSVSLSVELISFKISGANAYITAKTDDGFEIKCNFWKIKQYIQDTSFSAGERCKIEGKFAMWQNKFEIYLNLTSMTRENTKGTYMQLQQINRERIYSSGFENNKRIISFFPLNIGIITALGGAAIQDILQVFRQDGLLGNVTIKSALVQGNKCAESVIAGIKYFENNQDKYNIHILLITRGGGSYEDLVEFSNWNLIEKINETNMGFPFVTISAVGHQIDNQLTDDVCSYSFATPSISAKFIVETQQKYRNTIANVKRIISSMKNKLKHTKEQFQQIDYNKKICGFQQDYIMRRISTINNYTKNKLKHYNSIKSAFATRMSNMKPTMISGTTTKREITSIYDIIDNPEKVTNKLQKMDMVFYDGRLQVSYRIVGCEFY